MPLCVFIDSSVYLSFFSVSNDDLEELSKIVHLIENFKIKLIVPMQVKREFVRNRDKKIADALADFQKSPLKLPPIPRFMADYDEIKLLRQRLKDINEFRDNAVRKSRQEASRFSTRSDEIIEQIFRRAGIISDSDDIYHRARRRMDLGEPPGKPSSLGDRLNWEHMLVAVPVRDDLHIISKDKDFFSELDEEGPHYSLRDEWRLGKFANLHVHRELRKFLRKYFDDFVFDVDKRAREYKSFLQQRLDLDLLREKILSAEKQDNALTALASAREEEEIEEAITRIENVMSSMSNMQLKKITDIAITNEYIYTYSSNEKINIFFDLLITRIQFMLSKDEIANLERVFGIPIEQPTYDDELDLLTPNYQELDRELLDDSVDDLLLTWNEPAKPNEDCS